MAVRAAFDQAAGGPYRFEVAILAQRATQHGVGQVGVDAWCSEVIFARGQPSYATYVTEHLGLVWQSSAWRLESMSDTPGPSVALASNAAGHPRRGGGRRAGRVLTAPGGGSSRHANRRRAVMPGLQSILASPFPSRTRSA